MKKLLFIPLDYDKNPNPDFFKALSCVYDVMPYSFRLENRTLIQGFDPDYIFAQFGAIDPGLLSYIKQNTGAKVIMWTGDARAELMDNVTQYKGVCDLALLAVGVGQWGIYEAAMDCPVDYMQQGVFNSFFIEPQKMFSFKTVFIGNNYDHFPGAVERGELCKILAKEFIAFETIGNGYGSEHNNKVSCTYEQSAIIYNRSYISISHACFNDIEGYYSNRTIDIMAACGCCLQRWFPGIENYFTDGYDCIVYRTNDEAIEKIKYLIERPEIRNLIALNGHNTVKQKHTFNHRAKELKQLIEKYEL